VGVLTDDMTRLCDEIVTLRRGRRALNAERKNTVTLMCAGFARARAEMAHQTHAMRHAFLKNLWPGVHRHLRETRADLMGARRAWMGKGG